MRQIKNISDMLYEDLSLLYRSEKTHYNTLFVIEKNVHSFALKSDLKLRMERLQSRINNLEKAILVFLNQGKVNDVAGTIQKTDEKNHSVHDIALNNQLPVSTGSFGHNYSLTDYQSAFTFAKASGYHKVASIIHQIIADSDSGTLNPGIN